MAGNDLEKAQVSVEEAPPLGGGLPQRAVGPERQKSGFGTLLRNWSYARIWRPKSRVMLCDSAEYCENVKKQETPPP